MCTQRTNSFIRRWTRLMLGAAVASGCARTATVPPAETRQEPRHHEEHRFEDADRWAKVFESSERDAWQKPDHVLDALALPPEGKVADIGAATGYFAIRFARAVPQGVVYGVDIEPDMVRYLKDRAESEGLANLHSILCAPDDPRLPEPVDLIFICNTYHHIQDRPAYFARLKRSLRPGGRLVVVDFKEGKLPVGPPPEHKLAASTVLEELAAAGYELSGRDEGLPYQYCLTFRPLP